MILNSEQYVDFLNRYKLNVKINTYKLICEINHILKTLRTTFLLNAVNFA